MEAIPRRKEERIKTNKQLKNHIKFPDEKHHFSKTNMTATQITIRKSSYFFLSVLKKLPFCKGIKSTVVGVRNKNFVTQLGTEPQRDSI